MTQPVDILAPAIGACLNCRSLFLVTFDTPNCILCGNPPAFTLPFAPARGEPVEPREEQPAPAEEAPEPIPTGIVGSELILLEVISTFLDGGDIDQHYLSICFQDVGAHPEAAATAVGRLQAVRDLIRDLKEPPEAPAEVPSAPYDPDIDTVPGAPNARTTEV